MVFCFSLSLFLPESFGFHRRFDSVIFSATGLFFSLIFMSTISIVGKALFKKEALGWGDVKYIGAVGACLGLPGAFFSLLFASLSGSIYGVFIMIIKGKNLKTSIPFGPFLSIATVVWIFYGDFFLRMYFKVSEVMRGYLN